MQQRRRPEIIPLSACLRNSRSLDSAIVADQSRCQLGALMANVRNSDNLPKGRARDRADREEPSRGRAVPVDDRAIHLGLAADMQRRPMPGWIWLSIRRWPTSRSRACMCKSADHAGGHLLWRAVWWLDHGHRGQSAGRILVVMALMVGAMNIHSIQPGPEGSPFGRQSQIVKCCAPRVSRNRDHLPGFAVRHSSTIWPPS